MAKEDDVYEDRLRDQQIELVKLQRHLIETESRVLIIIEGRDAAGKDGTIRRITEHMSPRDTRVFAPSKPTDREDKTWYFQRFIPHFPIDGEFVLFNRSWYNRAGVERVMKFCNGLELETFFDTVGPFERMLVRSGMHLRKYYLDVSRKEQAKRLKERDKDPLKAWKTSPIDAVAAEKWGAYTKARDDMFRHTSHDAAPWHVVKSDDKKAARLALIGDLLEGFSFPGKRKAVVKPDSEVVFEWSKKAEKRLAY
jgi:polyphosphate kinase 2